MMESTQSFTFSAPFNWCDGACGRCPVSAECVVHSRLARRRREHEADGVDPDDWTVVMDDMARDLAEADEMMREGAERFGVDLDEIEDVAPVISLSHVRLSKAAGALVKVLASLSEELAGREATQAEQVASAMAGAMLMYAKVGRLAAYPGVETQAEQAEPYRSDVAPTLLLVEHVLADVTSAVDALADMEADLSLDAWRRALRTFQQRLSPWLEAVPEQARTAMDSLIRSGDAPSPFCVLS